MRISILILSLILSFCIHAKTNFGAKITIKESISLDKALINPENKKEVLIKATVEKVCKSKGCWMSLKGESDQHRVTFKDYSFFVPFNLVGKDVLVQGVIEKKTMSLSETKHYIEDEGGDVSKVTKPRTEYRIVASAVKVLEK